MIRYGRYEKLRRFVMDALEENVTSVDAVGSSSPQGLSRGAPATAQ
jgi:hypothetical protein